MTGPAMTFRLLDRRVGWDPRPGDGLAGVSLDDGVLRLTPIDTPIPGRGGTVLTQSMDGTWWLAGSAGLRRMGPCDDGFRAWGEARRVIDLAVRGRRVALVLARGRVEVLDAVTGQLLADMWFTDATRVELEGDGRITVTDRRGGRTWLDPSGLICEADPPCGPGDSLPPYPVSPRPWPADVPFGTNGFSLAGRGSFDWQGRRLATDDLGTTGREAERRGQFLSAALDSGVPGCHWHRIRIDADIPEGAGVEIAFATTDGPADGRTPAASAEGTWSDFPAGDPHPGDWFSVLAGATDSTLSAPRGRHAYLRIRLTSRGDTSPAVHQVRLDLPRSTSLEHLPAAYAEDPDAGDFTERFLSILDAELEEIDEVLARRSALLDAAALPDDALGWLAGLLGTGFEIEMPVANRRAVLRAAPELFRRRGTPRGLVETLQIALDVSCTVEEMGPARPWGAVGEAHLGSVRVFSRSTTRVRLGTSRLGVARVEGRGNPDQDALLAGAHRIRIHVPAGTDVGLVSRVVRSQIPAHVVFKVEAATAGFVATTLHLGIDTTLTPPASAVVGDLALGRRGVITPGRTGGVSCLVGRDLATRSRASEGKEMECTC
jgi:phage tail-like protein